MSVVQNANCILTPYVICQLIRARKLDKVLQLSEHSPVTHYVAINSDTLDVEAIEYGDERPGYTPLGTIPLDIDEIRSEAEELAFRDGMNNSLYPTLINAINTPIDKTPSLDNHFKKHFHELKLHEVLMNCLSESSFAMALDQSLEPHVFKAVIEAVDDALSLLEMNKDPAAYFCRLTTQSYKKGIRQGLH